MKKTLKILLMLLVSVSLFGCDDKKDTKKDSDVKIEEKEEKRVDLSLDDKLVDYYHKAIADDRGEYYSSNLCKKSTKADELEDIVKLNRSARLLTDKEVTNDKTNQVNFSRKAIDSHVKELFGNDTKLDYSKLNEINVFVQVKGSPITGKSLYGTYNSKTGIYNLSWGGIGGTCGLTNCTVRHADLVEAYTEKGNLYITEKQIFVYHDYNSSSVKKTAYSDYNKKNKIGSVTGYDADVDKFIDSGSSVTYVFMKVDKDTYNFVESIVK